MENKTAQSGINFLPEVAEKEIAAGVYKRKINLVAIASLLVVGLVIFGLISYQLFLSTQANQLQKDTKKAEDRVSKNVKVEITSQALKEKLDKAEKFLKEQVPGSVAISETNDAANTDGDANSNPEIILKKLALSSDGKYNVTGFATNSGVFGDWVTKLTNANGQTFFAKINMINFTGSPSIGYNFDFTLDFIKRGVYQPSSGGTNNETP